MSVVRFKIGIPLALCACVSLAAPASAETTTLRIGYQRTIAILPLIVMKDEKLVEAEAAKAGIKLKAEYTEFASGAPMNDAIISGNLDIGSTGTGPFLTLWSKSRGIVDVKGLSCLFTGTYDLVTNKPAIKSLKDFGETDRIAVPAVGISIQAMILQMAAAKTFGVENWKKMDHLTVSLPQPDGLTALTSGGSQITGQLAGPPFQQFALRHKGITKVLSSNQVFAGGFTGTLTYASKKFVEANPKVTKIFMAAVRRAIQEIRTHKRKTAEIFIGSGKLDPALVEQVLGDPSVSYSVVPKNVLTLATFMHKTGRLKDLPSDWRDFFHKQMHDLPGS